MICRYCNKDLQDGSNICSVCGKKVDLNTSLNNRKYDLNNENKIANKWCLLSLFLFLSPVIIALISNLISGISGVFGINNLDNIFIFKLFYKISDGFPLFGLVLMIYVRVKYPRNTFGIVLMVLYPICIILLFSFLVLIMISCGGSA